VFLVSCDETLTQKITRDSNTDSSIELSKVVPLYETECEYQSVYGPDVSCGSYHDRYYGSYGKCGYDKYGRGYCPRGGRSVRYRSCYHQKRYCQQYRVGTFDASVILNFDQSTELEPGQKEKYSFKGRYKNGIVSGRLKIKSKYYEYEEMENIIIENGKTAIIDVRSLGRK